jgi:amidohydrolase
MHACGHDVHLAALTAVARAARSRAHNGRADSDRAGSGRADNGRADNGRAGSGRAGSGAGLPAGLLAVLQPREETHPSGARDIVASAAFASHSPRAVVGVHLQPQLPPGTVAATPGTVNAATDDFEIRVEGTGGHAGYPHLTADPVIALCQAVIALQQIVSRRTDPTHAAVVSVGMLDAGQAPNVIPGTATARGSVRALDQTDRPALHAALQEIVQHTCRAHRCRGTVTIVPGEPALVNDEGLAAASLPFLREAGFTVDTSFRSCGADDFSYYGASAPTLMLFVGTGGPVSLHHPEFLPDDGTVGQVATAMLAGYLGALSCG